MAEEAIKAIEELQSLEVDAALSVQYFNLPDLDIGSEIVVESNLKQGAGKVTDKLGTECVTDKSKLEVESGLGDLKLAEQLPEQKEEGGNSGSKSSSDVDDNVQLLEELEQQDSEGDTLLHVAVICLNEPLACQIIWVLADLEGTVNIQNSLLQTPLHLAAITLQKNIARELLTAGASMATRDHELQTPMHIACKKDNYDMLETILKHGTWDDVTSGARHPLNFPDANGERCLHLAVKMDNVPMAQLLVSQGADVNLPHRKNGRTPLHIAAELGLVEMTKFLISVPNIDCNQRTFNDETAAEIADVRDKTDVVHLLKPLSYPIMKRRSKSESAYYQQHIQ